MWRGLGASGAVLLVPAREQQRPGRLSSDRAEALILCFFSELSFTEAASVLGKSEAAVKMLVSRGLQDLRARSSIALEMDYE